MKIALISMPWVEADIPPLGIASLKSCLEADGASVDCLHLNLLMFSRIGSLATALARDMTWSEWLFGYHLFGPGGTREFTEELNDLRRHKSFQAFLTEIKAPLPRLEKLVHDEIPRFLDDCLTQASWRQYDLIGFSSVFASHTACLTLARELKARFPDKKIVFGGANVDGAMGAATLKGCDWIDYVVDGEGEDALVQLSRNLRLGKPYDSVPRVSCRRDGEIVPAKPGGAPPVDLKRLPVPDHEDFFAALKRYDVSRNTDPAPTFEASRGCWWGQKQHCTFCSFNGEAMTFRAKDVAQVVRDVVTLHRRHRAGHLRAADNIMGLEHLRLLLPELARVKREEKLDWKIFFEIKANLTEAQIAALADAGVVSIQSGIESLSTPILKLMRKGVSALQNVQTIKLGAMHGMDVQWNILWGFPGEPSGEYERMASAVMALTHLQPPSGGGRVRVERFSPYHFDWKRLGMSKPPVPQDFYRFIYPPSRFRGEDIAYRFDFASHEGAEEAETAGLAEAVAFWKSVWSRNFLAYRQGMGFVEVFDTRPLKIGRSAQWREAVLDGLDALIFAHCGSIAGFDGVLAACRAAEPGCGAKRVQRILDGMVDKKWFYHEDGRYLNLALPVSRLPAQQRVLFDQFNGARRGLLDQCAAL